MRRLLDFVKFEHTVFSVPVLLAGAFLGARGVPPAMTLVWILVAGTGARTLAMALNRIADRGIDARNPRTASRELPSGRLSLGAAWGVAAAGAAAFGLAVANLPPLCAKLLPIPLAIFALYPLMKRFTPLAHFGVGAGLGFGPIGAYVAVTGHLVPDGGSFLLALFTWAWVSGFDIIYATLDEDFDRAEGLHSLPSAIGRRGALVVAAAVHVAAVAALVLLTARYAASPVSWGLCAVTAGLLAVEHWQAHRVDLAFFHINAVVAFVVFALVWTGV
ncbi:putative 4-hydroxybenzoate polyprenyltransferase [bacterium]|nr:putative 4-hydroxybenzoate polyprenyltransferase [bacterium]